MGRKLTYIESNGTQYIATGFKPNQNTRVVMDFHNIGDYSGMSTGLCPVLGARNEVAAAAFALWIGAKSFPHYGNVAYNANGNFTTDINRRLTYDFNKNVVSIGDDSITCAIATFTTNYDLCILTANNNGNIESRRASGKLYSCQIYDNGALIRDFVPWENDNGKIGLLDRVNNVFYGDAAGGNFISGDYVSELFIHKFEGLENDVPYYARVFPMSRKECAQSELGGQLANVTPCAFPVEPSSYILIDTYTGSIVFTAPEDGHYKIEFHGASGGGGGGSWSGQRAAGGGGGGGGGCAIRAVKLLKGDKIITNSMTVGSTAELQIESSLEVYPNMLITSGKTGGNGVCDTGSINPAGGAGGAGGEASGGDENYNGSKGKNGGAGKHTDTYTANGGAGGESGYTGGNVGGKGATYRSINEDDTGEKVSNAESGKAAFVKIYRGNTNKVA